MRRRPVLALVAGSVLGTSCAGPEPGPRAPSLPLEITVATWNLRLNTPADGLNAWPLRREAVKALILRHGFDVLGTQEGLADQIDELAGLPGYAQVGVGRDDGRRAGEFAAIFYRRERFAAVDHGDFWLSETPERPSRGWDARCCNRLASWARLREPASGREFVVLSVHFDHEGAVARRESARLVLRRLRQIAGDLPAVCVGDFNATPASEPIRLMTAALRDAREAALEPPAGPVGTFNGFAAEAPLNERIDYVFVGPGWRVLRYAALDDRHAGRWPSDHLPVMTRLALD